VLILDVRTRVVSFATEPLNVDMEATREWAVFFATEPENVLIDAVRDCKNKFPPVLTADRIASKVLAAAFRILLVCFATAPAKVDIAATIAFPVWLLIRPEKVLIEADRVSVWDIGPGAIT
jgi:hypothetical protein